MVQRCIKCEQMLDEISFEGLRDYPSTMVEIFNIVKKIYGNEKVKNRFYMLAPKEKAQEEGCGDDEK